MTECKTQSNRSECMERLDLSDVAVLAYAVPLVPMVADLKQRLMVRIAQYPMHTDNQNPRE